MALFNPHQRRFYGDLFGQLRHIPNNVVTNRAGALGRGAVAAAGTAVSEFIMGGTDGTGRTRSGSSFRTPPTPSNKKQPTIGAKRPISQSSTEETGRHIRRRISTQDNPPYVDPTIQATMASTGTNGDEVPVVPLPKRVSKIMPDYQSIQLPFYAKYTVTTGMVNSTNYVAVRLNSIYDPIQGTTSNRQPQGRDNYAQLWNFYRVLGSQIKVTFLNNQHAQAVQRPSQQIWAVGNVP